MRLALGALLAVNVLYALWGVLRPTLDEPHQLAQPLQRVTADPAPVSLAGDALSCVELGPFTDEEGSRVFASQLLVGSHWSVVSRSLPAAIRHRVYVPAAPNRAAAQDRLAEVRGIINQVGGGIDSYLVTSGELDNAVSLGVFAEMANAQRVQDLLADQPVEVKIRDESRAANQYWLRVSTDKMLDFSEKNDLEVEFQGVIAVLEQNVCETIAQRD